MKRLVCLILILSTPACSRWVGSLRRDLDDRPIEVPAYEPTVGGQAYESGYLDTPGHADRSPASSAGAEPPAWAAPEEYQPSAQREVRPSDVPNSNQYSDYAPAV